LLLSRSRLHPDEPREYCSTTAPSGSACAGPSVRNRHGPRFGKPVRAPLRNNCSLFPNGGVEAWSVDSPWPLVSSGKSGALVTRVAQNTSSARSSASSTSNCRVASPEGHGGPSFLFEKKYCRPLGPGAIAGPPILSLYRNGTRKTQVRRSPMSGTTREKTTWQEAGRRLRHRRFARQSAPPIAKTPGRGRRQHRRSPYSKGRGRSGRPLVKRELKRGRRKGRFRDPGGRRRRPMAVKKRPSKKDGDDAWPARRAGEQTPARSIFRRRSRRRLSRTSIASFAVNVPRASFVATQAAPQAPEGRRANHHDRLVPWASALFYCRLGALRGKPKGPSKMFHARAWRVSSEARGITVNNVSAGGLTSLDTTPYIPPRHHNHPPPANGPQARKAAVSAWSIWTRRPRSRAPGSRFVAGPESRHTSNAPKPDGLWAAVNA